MRYRLLGNSGLRVSEAALGTMTFGDDWGWGAAKDEARKVYDAFREAGGNFIDTANMYTNGTSESFLGEFMKGHRESVVLATKYTNAAPGTDPNAAGNHRKNMVQAVEASLKRLQTDYIDLYWVHIWDQITPVEEVMRGLDDLVRQGKVLYVGISDAPAWWIAQANTLAHLRGWSPFVGLQIEYSLIERTVERELIPMAKALEPRRDRVVAAGRWRSDRKVPRSRIVRAGPYERRHDEAVPAGRTTDRAHRRGREDRVRRGRPQHGSGRSSMAPLPTRGGHPHYRGAKALAIAGQPRKLRLGALRRPVENAGRVKPDRTRIPA